MMKTLYSLLAVVPLLAFGDVENNNSTTTTNLSDKLNTEIIYDRSSGIDIRRLNLDSIHTDKHKSRHASVRSINVDVRQPKKILLVHPLLEKDESGKYSHKRGRYVNVNDIKCGHIKKNMIIDPMLTSDILITDLNPAIIKLDGPSVTSTKINGMSIESLIKNYSLMPMNTDVTKIDIINMSKSIPMVTVDASRYSVDVSDKTFAELKEMKLIYRFEDSYKRGSIKQSAMIDDIRKLQKELYIKWIDILSSNKTCNISYIKNKIKRKIAGEAWIYNKMYGENDRQNMLSNLQFLKSKGYDSVLVRFSCNEDKTQLIQMIDDIKAAGFNIFSTYVGKDGRNPSWNPYIDPVTLESYIVDIAPKCIGFMLNWRGTSSHVKILPNEFFNYMCNTVRKHNSNILIYGEIYYGTIGALKMIALVYTVPQNVTGVVINNMGYNGCNIQYIVKTMFASHVPGYKRLDKIGQVIGISPYYCSKPERDMHLSIEDEYKYKKAIEDEFWMYGCGTVTMIHDGIDDNYTWVAASPTCQNKCDTTDNIVYDKKLRIDVQ